MGYVGLACQWALAAVFGLAVWGKTRGRAELAGFGSALASTGLVAPHRTGVVVAMVVACEIVVVVLLMAPATVSAGFVLAAAVCAVFALGITISVRRGAHAPCRCFGASSTPLGPVHVLRNVLLIGLACLGLSAPSLDGLDAAGVVVAMFAAAVLVLIVRFLDEIVGVFAVPAVGR